MCVSNERTSTEPPLETTCQEDKATAIRLQWRKSDILKWDPRKEISPNLTARGKKLKESVRVWISLNFSSCLCVSRQSLETMSCGCVLWYMPSRSDQLEYITVLAKTKSDYLFFMRNTMLYNTQHFPQSTLKVAHAILLFSSQKKRMSSRLPPLSFYLNSFLSLKIMEKPHKAIGPICSNTNARCQTKL